LAKTPTVVEKVHEGNIALNPKQKCVLHYYKFKAPKPHLFDHQYLGSDGDAEDGDEEYMEYMECKKADTGDHVCTKESIVSSLP
jgi:hypothetical protein